MTEIWAVAHQAHPTTYRDTKHEALALVDAWTTEQAAAICWPMTVEESARTCECHGGPHGGYTCDGCL